MPATPMTSGGSSGRLPPDHVVGFRVRQSPIVPCLLPTSWSQQPFHLVLEHAHDAGDRRSYLQGGAADCALDAGDTQLEDGAERARPV
jgi:hypothetical protein